MDQPAEVDAVNAYAVLGLGFGATPGDAEAAYHRLLFRWHPDRHASEGPEAVALAEARTRQLNEAIDQNRRGTAAPPTNGYRPAAHGPRAAHDPAEQTRVLGPVPCPFCGEPMTSLAGFDVHLHERHPEKAVPRRRGRRSPRRWWPPSMAQFVLVDLVVVLVVMVAVLAVGGHDAAMDRLQGITPAQRSAMVASDPGRCPDGRYPATWGPVMGDGCSDRDWPLGYLAIGMFPSLLYYVYRKTTT
jgi:hypothetical protein